MRWVQWLPAVLLLGACSSRTADSEQDFSADVERICESMCAMVMACREPPIFDTHEACVDSCAMPGFMVEDSACGQALRDYRECIGDTQTCEAYLDTLAVDAETFTCQAEGQAFAALECGAMEGASLPGVEHLK